MSLETIKLVSLIEPQPTFGAAHLMSVPLSSYFFELPTTYLYLKRFPLEMDVLKDFELVRRCLDAEFLLRHYPAKSDMAQAGLMEQQTDSIAGLMGPIFGVPDSD